MSIEVEIKPEDVKVTNFDPDQGRGNGWSLNSAVGVELTHIPTGTVVRASSRPTAAANRASAEIMLKDSLHRLAYETRLNELGNKWLTEKLSHLEEEEAILTIDSAGISWMRKFEVGAFKILPENRSSMEALISALPVKPTPFDPAGFGFKVDPVVIDGRTVAYSLSDPGRARTLTAADKQFNAGLEAAAALLEAGDCNSPAYNAAEIRKLKRK